MAGDVAPQIARAFIGVRDLVLQGAFAPGERISELPLVARLGMSRTPIRLALEQLAHIGLLDAGDTGGFSVRQFTLSDVLDAIELRGVLEGTAARLAAERLTSLDELGPIRQVVAQMAQLPALTIDSFAAFMDLNEGFHAALIELSKSAMLQRNLQQGNLLPFASPSAMVFPTSTLPNAGQHLAVANLQHRAIVDAIGERQGTRAESIAREHAFLARRVFEMALADADVRRRVPGGALIRVS